MPRRAYLSLALLGFDPLMTAELYKVLEFIFIVTLRKSDGFTFQQKVLKHLCFSFVIGLEPVDAGVLHMSCPGQL